jgi:hypothetical protein
MHHCIKVNAMWFVEPLEQVVGHDQVICRILPTHMSLANALKDNVALVFVRHGLDDASPMRYRNLGLIHVHIAALLVDVELIKLGLDPLPIAALV